LEEAGLATVQLSAIRNHTERLRPPRALYCDFPFGRPLGKPGDPAFQRRVLLAAFALLERPTGPVLEDFPETVADAGDDEPLACTLPPRLDPNDAPAVDEARGLRAAYERQLARTGRTSLGMVSGPDAIPALVAAFVRIADGVAAEDAGLPSDPHSAALDINAYYEEAALALADHIPAARATETWFFHHTETGRVLRAAQAALIAAGRTDFLATVVPRGQE